MDIPMEGKINAESSEAALKISTELIDATMEESEKKAEKPGGSIIEEVVGAVGTGDVGDLPDEFLRMAMEEANEPEEKTGDEHQFIMDEVENIVQKAQEMAQQPDSEDSVINALEKMILDAVQEGDKEVEHIVRLELDDLLLEAVRSPSESESTAQRRGAEVCWMFSGIRKMAEHIVEKTIETAAEEIKVATNQDVRSRPLPCKSEDIEWPFIGEFSEPLGRDKIEEFLETWKIGGEWAHCIDLLTVRSDVFSSYYVYEVKWSIPTKEYPIPQATVSVFFTVEVSKVKPMTCPVEVTFEIETEPYVHMPGKGKFREEWLHNILKRKIEFFKTLRF